MEQTGPAGQGAVSRRPVTVLIKPASSLCNLNCAYCFYLEKQRLYPWAAGPRMTLETFARFWEQYVEMSSPWLSLAWQGGEPTVMGLPFFQQVLARQHATLEGSGRRAHNALQTNGLLLDPDWAAFLREEGFLVGLSLDGPPEWHDRYRRDRGGRPTQARVLAALRLLQEERVPFNALTVVHRANAGSPRELFSYLVGLGLDNLQFIPLAGCTPGLVAEGGMAAEYALTPEEYADFLSGLLEAWLAHGFRRVRIRYLDNIVQLLLGQPSELCQLAPTCGYLVLEHNGDLYPCDFFVDEAWRLGNVHECSLAEVLGGSAFARFRTLKWQLPAACRACRWRPLCHGECPGARADTGGASHAGLPYLCSAYQRFFSRSLGLLQQVAHQVRREAGIALPQPGLGAAWRSAQPALAAVGAPAESRPAAPGRNDPCVCGSGRKFKQCCGRQPLAGSAG